MGPERALLGPQPLARGDVGGGQHEELPVGGGVNRPVMFSFILCVPMIYVLVGVSATVIICRLIFQIYPPYPFLAKLVQYLIILLDNSLSLSVYKESDLLRKGSPKT